ncbi:MAG: hypothetical protein LAT67_05755 [Balneolales bacterium]|nr:hypothetical protein [Balneolales bacterium]
MLNPITGKRRKFKRFDYQPRYYDPSKEKSKKIKAQIHFEKKTSRGQGRSILLYAALLFGLFYIFLQL